ncbi:MAG TPA: hypothetical protein VLE53_18640 [Gemmatimonadaceae bacterium]|nr:hypothetical protein [Gemmatimonadaceae bacterium]
MKPRSPSALQTAVAACSTAILVACQDAPTAVPGDEANAVLSTANGAATSAGLSATHNAELAQLRRLVAHYHDLDRAMAAGYAVEVTPCLELPGVGGMGYHYGNPNFINNSVAVLLEPELLLYEPQRNGGMRFVGVEYIIPFTELPPTATPPTLLGQTFHADANIGIWALHVWVGRENPAGLFADWNPKVSCEFD